MANNFKNAIKTDISAVETAPTEVYYHATKKSIVIELDAANKSSAGVNISVAVEDTDQNGSALGSLSLTDHANGTFTRNSHGLDVNDRITIQLSAAPAIVGGGSLDVTKRYYVQFSDTNTFRIAETRSATVPLKFTGAGTLTSVTKHHFAEVVRDAPIPVGGALKVISGQKLVLENTDRLFVHASAADSVDVVCSILEEVS